MLPAPPSAAEDSKSITGCPTYLRTPPESKGAKESREDFLKTTQLLVPTHRFLGTRASPLDPLTHTFRFIPQRGSAHVSPLLKTFRGSPQT